MPKSALRTKLENALESGKDWQVLDFGHEYIFVQILPESKNLPRRLALFITKQGKQGRKGLRIADTDIFQSILSEYSDDKTIKIAEIIGKINPAKVETDTKDYDL